LNLTDIKGALIAALEEKAKSWDGMTSLRLDVRFRKDGTVNAVSLCPLFELAVRGKCPPLSDYDFLADSTGETNRLT
jgi:hypothetical protein